MHRSIFAVAVILALVDCGKSSAPSSTTSSSSVPADAIEKKLQELAGIGATNCGRLTSQDPAKMDVAAKCATQAAQAKRPFYVAYDLPGMTVAVAGNSDGKLFTVQSQQNASAQSGDAAGLASGPCPAELRVAQSGRVTCYAPGSFGMGMEGSHGGMSMPPAMGTNPHGATGALPPGHPTTQQPQSTSPPPKKP